MKYTYHYFGKFIVVDDHYTYDQEFEGIVDLPYPILGLDKYHDLKDELYKLIPEDKRPKTSGELRIHSLSLIHTDVTIS